MARVKAVFFLPLRDNDGRDLAVERGEAENSVSSRVLTEWPTG